MKEVTLQNYNHIFWELATKYDTINDNIIRKIIHSFSVAEKCFSIASSLHLNKKQRQLCYFVGLFHDIGRFEQWKHYGTYNDKLSENHGFLSAKMVQEIVLNCDLTKREREIAIETIKYHNANYEGADEDVRFYHQILKNGDMFANVITASNGIHQISIEKDGVTEPLLNDFLNLKKLYKYNQTTKLDRALMLTALTYYIDFDFLTKEIIEKHYIDSIYETFSVYLNKEDKLIYKNAIETLKKKLDKKNK